jgi:hypothetical protein
MKFAKMFMLVLAMATVVSCTSEKKEEIVEAVGCAVEKSAVSLISSKVSTELVCKNLDAVKADIQAIVGKANLCKKEEAPAVGVMSLGVGSVICEPVAVALVEATKSQIPAAWECTGGTKPEELKALVLEACSKAL